MAKVATMRKPAQLDERADLRAAIGAAAEAKQRLEGHRSAIDAARRQTVPEALAALEKLRSTTADNQAKIAEQLAVSLGGTVGRAKSATQMRPILAEDRVSEAERRLSVARAALDHLTKTLPDAELALAQATNDVLIQVQNLMVPIIQKLIDDGEAARRTFIASRAALRGLTQDFRSPPKFDRHDAVNQLRASAARLAPLAELGGETIVAHGLYTSRDEELDHEHKFVLQVQQMREALIHDADAPLPSVE